MKKATKIVAPLPARDPAPQNNHTPPDPRIAEYEDSEEADLSAPVAGWPRRVPLKFQRKFPVGEIQIDWQEFVKRLLSALFGQTWTQYAKPNESLESVLLRMLQPENHKLFLHDVTIISEYVMLHAPQKLNDALMDLTAEAHQHVINHKLSDIGEEVSGHAKFAHGIADREAHRIEQRMKGTGQKLKSRKGQHSKWTSEKLIAALSNAITALMNQGKKIPSTNRRLLELIAAELKNTHSTDAPKDWDSLRKLMSSLHVGPEWDALKSEWKASQKRQSGK